MFSRQCSGQLQQRTQPLWNARQFVRRSTPGLVRAIAAPTRWRAALSSARDPLSGLGEVAMIYCTHCGGEFDRFEEGGRCPYCLRYFPLQCDSCKRHFDVARWKLCGGYCPNCHEWKGPIEVGPPKEPTEPTEEETRLSRLRLGIAILTLFAGLTTFAFVASFFERGSASAPPGFEDEPNVALRLTVFIFAILLWAGAYWCYRTYRRAQDD